MKQNGARSERLCYKKMDWREGVRRGSESSDGCPPTALPVVEQIGPAAERSDCRGDQASADRWLPPSIGHRSSAASTDWKSVHTQHSSRPRAQTGGL